MTIRFLPYWLGLTLGWLIYIYVVAFMNGAEQSIQWEHEVFASFCIGFISACFYTVVMAAIFTVVMAINEAKRLGYVKVRIW